MLSCVALALASHSAAAADVFVQIRIEGVINPVKARYARSALVRAGKEEARFLLVILDTPGGLVSSMEQIVTTLSNGPLPVVAFVAPRSAQATSAGAFLLLAADVAAMAPGTRVGAAHPVADGKPLEGALDAKATNSLASLIVSLAERRGRPREVAEAMVRESASYTAEEAHAKHLVELIAADPGDLLQRLDGVEVRGGVQLSTRGLTAIELDLSRSDRLLDALASPTLTSLLLSIGTLAILYELATSGIGAGGVIGAILVVLGLFGGSVLPIELSGVVLLVIGAVALALEVKLPTHGVLGGAGFVGLLLGSLLLVDSGEYFGGLERPSPLLLAPLLAVVALAFFLLGRVARRALAAPPQTGAETLLGKLGQARTSFGQLAAEPSGQVLVDGVRWQAETRDELIHAGETIEVLGVSRGPLRLLVRRKQ
ncbi:MAG TPA: NfeD family protein [Polyangiaceae bacterium]|nr:NfeD family protein [Polyangiaceae bacterium]